MSIVLRLALLLALLGLPGCATPRTQWGLRFADWLLAAYPDPWALHGGGWEYNAGIVLYGLSRVYVQSGEVRYRDYIQRWVDHFVDAEGRVAIASSQNLDLIQPGLLLLFLYEETGDPRYRRAADQVLARLAAHPRNALGGFWHKDIYPQQMWLDGLYMAGPFCVRHARLWGAGDLCPAEALRQAALLTQHTQDSASGLLYHAWSADGTAPWADAASGQSPVVWGRGMGWYLLALVEMLSDLPPQGQEAAQLRAMLQTAARGVAAAQDPHTGLWRQILDEPTLADNWFETSASAMFVYALQVGAERGWLEGRYSRVAARGWRGLQAKLSLGPDGAPQVADAVEGMGVQPSAADYLAKQRLTNSTHGLAAVLLAASVMEW